MAKQFIWGAKEAQAQKEKERRHMKNKDKQKKYRWYGRGSYNTWQSECIAAIENGLDQAILQRFCEDAANRGSEQFRPKKSELPGK